MFIQPSSLVVALTIRLDEDWCDSFPPLPAIDGGAIDLTDKVLQLYVRPAFDDPALLAIWLSNADDSDEGIMIDDATAGLASIRVSRASLVAAIPLPPRGRSWAHFLVMRDADRFTEVWRGPLYVLPGRIGG